MPLPIEDLTPRQIVAELDKYIVGQNAAKKAVAVALRNRYRRQQLPPDERDDIMPKNILMIGPTGVGKTEIARRLAQLARAPFIKVEATKFTEVGYVGRDVESMVRDLAAAAVRLVEKERIDAVRDDAERRAKERLVELIQEQEGTSFHRGAVFGSFGHHGMETFRFGAPESEDEQEEINYDELRAKAEARRAELMKMLEDGSLDDREVDVEIEESQNPFVQVFTPQGMEEMGIDTNQVGGPFGSKRTSRRASVPEAKEILFDEEAKKLIDRSSLNREAITRAEQTGIIFLDEIDKVAGKNGGSGPDVSREGVQRDLLPIIEGSTVVSKFGSIRTDHVLFIAAGAFHMSSPSDLIPELQGRLPIRVQLENLSENDFRRILFEPKNALTRQYERLLETEGVRISFTDDALDEIAHLATEVNTKIENIGARRLHTIMERLLEQVLFEAPEIEQKEIRFNAALVRERLSDLTKNAEMSRKVL